MVAPKLFFAALLLGFLIIDYVLFWRRTRMTAKTDALATAVAALDTKLDAFIADVTAKIAALSVPVDESAVDAATAALNVAAGKVDAANAALNVAPAADAASPEVITSPEPAANDAAPAQAAA